jgi:hypothetical protein
MTLVLLGLSQGRAEARRRSKHLRGSVALTKNQVNSVVGAHVPELQACYDHALKLDPKLVGRLAFSWKIDSRGHVHALRAASSSRPLQSLEACLRVRIKRWTFPRSVRGMDVRSYPFIFEPAS